MHTLHRLNLAGLQEDENSVLQHVGGFEGIWEAGHLLISVHKLVFQYDAGLIKATQRPSLSWSQYKPFSLSLFFCASLL